MVVYPRSGGTGVPAQPSLPALERDVLEYWQAQDTFQSSHRPAARCRADRAPTSSCSTTLPACVRQRAAALRAPAHRVRQGPGPALPDHAQGQEGRAQVRLGPATACPAEVEAERRARDHRRRPRSWPWGSRSSTRPAAPRCCATPASGATTSPGRPAGSTSTTTTRRWTSTTWKASCGRSSSACGTRALVYQGFKVLPYCWRCETPLSNHELRMDDDTYAERQDPAVHGPVQAGDR